MTEKQRITKIIEWFKTNIPVAETELNYNTPYQLLIAVMLSAQCTDKRVNIITEKFFKTFPNCPSVANASISDIYEQIKSCSYPNNKAKHIYAMSNMLLSEFKGELPDNVDDLQRLPGVGRKTANVIAAIIFNKPTMAVDTHVFRVSERLGLSKNAKTPLQTEKQLMKIFDLPDIPLAHHWLILHGRYVCTARNPKCKTCGLTEWCIYNYQTQ